MSRAKPASTAGYSGTPLVAKLGVKQGTTIAVVGAPRGYRELLSPLPPDVRFVAKPGAST